MAALRAPRARRSGCLCALLTVSLAAMAAGAAATPERIEARSSDLYAVGVVQGDRMSVRLSSTTDNAPVTNAVLAVTLRGSTHPATAEADGSYSIQSADLALPGPAVVAFLITLGSEHEELKGSLEGPTAEAEDTRGGSRQIGWWVLNFAVCTGFLWLWSRRKSADD